ncbi:uncharacterized protein IL334_003409 [Kwoniella shivajii]|uniref:Uncharacterized protein n=1 Tax=Kwoniella shivajii TaxID=564305 RepID=A0ABZ1CXU6_9TREE|nr:hypothetical protein IL334_003409 [Kwoniella shivajii]
MSLGVSPSSPSPLQVQFRPLPPNRKRNSYTPSPRSTPRFIQEPKISLNDDSSLVGPSSGKDQDGVLGGLRERSEEELGLAGREELEDALRKGWAEREILLQRIKEAESDRERLEGKHDELVKGLTALQSKNDEAFNEQSRMEADLEERDELLDRLRNRLAEAEKQARDGQKRYIEQEETFDLERRALQAQENHLQQRLKIISSSRRPVTPSESDNVASLKDELASINLSHSTLLAKLNTITKELHDLKAVNEELQEENEGWEFLIRETTLNGKVRGEGGILSERFEDRSPNECRYIEPNESTRIGLGIGSDRLDEDLEDEMSELHSDLEAQSPIFEDDHFLAIVTDLGDGKGDLLAPPRKRRIRKERTASAPNNAQGAGGLDLAAELGMAEYGSDSGNSALSGKERVDQTAALRAEIKQLKESNKALTLYCSKIIDRIIAQEGFEHVLSVDYKTRRAGTRSTSSSSRPALKDITAGPWSLTTSPSAEEPPRIAEPVKEKKARPLSMMVRAMTGPAERTDLPSVQVDTVTTAEAESKQAKAEKRARRGFSLDFRSLGFGSSSSSSDSKSSLRPLTLSSRSATSTAPIPPPRSAAARKLDIHEEDEEDQRERHRLEATLKLMGIDRKSPSPSIQEEDFPLSDATWRGNNMPRTSGRSSNSSGSHRSTPLTRLSAIFANENEDLLPLEFLEDPRQAAAALKAFDEREAKKREDLAKGKREPQYTSPPKANSRRLSAEDRSRTISKSESIKTLWSMGGDSRPGSGEVVLDKKVL